MSKTVKDMILEDDEVKRLVAREAIDTSRMIKTGLKWTGGAILLGLVVWGGYKLVNRIIEGRKKDEELENAKNSIHTENLNYPATEYDSMANTIYKAFDPTSSGNLWDLQSYDESTIISILSKMKNMDDWNMLVYKFGSRTNAAAGGASMTLIDFLREDDASDKKKYQQILDLIGAKNLLT